MLVITRGGWRRPDRRPPWRLLAALGALAGVLVTVLGGARRPGRPPDAARAPVRSAAAQGAPAVAGLPLTLSASARLLPGSVPAVATKAARPAAVAPLRRSVQADLLVVAPASLPGGLLARVNKLPGMVQAERVEAFQMPVNGAETAVVGVDPSQFRSFAAHPTGAATAPVAGRGRRRRRRFLHDGQARQDPARRLGAGGRAGRSRKLPVVAFGTLGIGGVNAVVSDATAAALGAPAGQRDRGQRAPGRLHRRQGRPRPPRPPGRCRAVAGLAGHPPLGNLGHHPDHHPHDHDEPDSAGAGSASAPSASGPVIQKMLEAALSRVGLPYVYGAAGPDAFDCSGLVQWSFAQAGITMPRVAADQAQAGPAVPVSQLQPGDLLFYHTDPTAPGYISHVAIYLGHGKMIQAPQPGEDVQVVPLWLGSEFAGAIRVSPAQGASAASGL